MLSTLAGDRAGLAIAALAIGRIIILPTPKSRSVVHFQSQQNEAHSERRNPAKCVHVHFNFGRDRALRHAPIDHEVIIESEHHVVHGSDDRHLDEETLDRACCGSPARVVHARRSLRNRERRKPKASGCHAVKTAHCEEESVVCFLPLGTIAKHVNYDVARPDHRHCSCHMRNDGKDLQLIQSESHGENYEFEGQRS